MIQILVIVALLLGLAGPVSALPPHGWLATVMEQVPPAINAGGRNTFFNCNSNIGHFCGALYYWDTPLAGWRFQRFIQFQQADAVFVYYNMIFAFDGGQYIAFVDRNGNWTPYKKVK